MNHARSARCSFARLVVSAPRQVRFLASRFLGHQSGTLAASSPCAPCAWQMPPVPIPPPHHPTYSIAAVRMRQRSSTSALLRPCTQVIAAALEEDSAGIGDVTTLATCVLPRPRVRAATSHAVAGSRQGCRRQPRCWPRCEPRSFVHSTCSVSRAGRRRARRAGARRLGACAGRPVAEGARLRAPARCSCAALTRPAGHVVGA